MSDLVGAWSGRRAGREAFARVPVYALFVFVFGLVVGSFTNVVVYRLPRHESIAFPPSHCPECGARLRPLDLIPIASYLALRGSCRYCGKPIPPRYPLIELAVGLLFLLVYLARGAGWGLIPGFGLAALMVAVAAIDLGHQIIPNALTFIGVIAGLAFALVGWSDIGFVQAVVGAITCGGFLLMVGLAGRGGMGGGDVKLGAVMGAFLGWRAGLFGILLGFVAGAVVGLGLMIAGRKGRRDPIPFGPFLALGALISHIWGKQAIEAYVRLWMR